MELILVKGLHFKWTLYMVVGWPAVDLVKNLCIMDAWPIHEDFVGLTVK